MSKKEFGTFCNISNYIEQVDPALYKIIDHCCSLGLLSSSKTKVGVTFLWPQDKKFAEKLETLAYSFDPEDGRKAENMINAHVLRHKFRSAADFEAMKKDIPNALTPSQHVPIKSASGKEVVFANGAKAVLDEKFKDMRVEDNLTVWKLTGEIPVTTDSPATNEFVKLSLERAVAKKNAVRQGAKTGAYELSVAQSQSLRHNISLAVENSYALACMQRDSSVKNPPRDIFLETSLSFIWHLMNCYAGNDKDEQVIRAVTLFSYHKVDFYFLIQPHEVSGHYLFSDDVIAEWWKCPSRGTFNHQECIARIEAVLSARGDPSAAVSQRETLNAAISKLRGELAQVRDRTLLDKIGAAYAVLDENNSVGSVSSVFPSSLAHFYKTNAGLKQVQDGLRFLTHDMFESLERAPQFDHGYYRDILSIIGTALHASTLDERKRALMVFNENMLKYVPNPTEVIATILTFVNSSCFIQITQTRDTAPRYSKTSLIRPPPLSNAFFDIDARIALKHKRLMQDASAQEISDIVSKLNNINAASLDPALKEALAKFA